MPAFPRDYDPKSAARPRRKEEPVKRLPPPSVVDQDKPASIKVPPVFGRKITPPEDVLALPPICPDECRLIDFGGCDGTCRLMCRS
jgi:hypothetical protein